MILALGIVVSPGNLLRAFPGQASREQLKLKYRRPTEIPFPDDNRWSKEKELLGRTLFFDPRLSGSGWISCATCHNPGLSWGDGLPKALGEGMHSLNRRTPTILNAAWMDLLFWDGRARSLEEQALGPITSPGEMDLPPGKLLTVIKCTPGYVTLFANAFPERAAQSDDITAHTLVEAIATFERTLVSGRAPFDEWIEGREDAISPEAVAGFDLFNGKAGCARCHSGWNFTDGGFRDIGTTGVDPGRGKFIPLLSQSHAFKTPGLREIDRRAPYMHNGTEATLEKVIDFYDRGGDLRRAGISPDIAALHLTDSEKKALVVFLKTLTSHDTPVIYPELPR